MGLAKKLPAPAAVLSGGMKRKLQVALALLGRPAIVVIDEGSSGAHPLLFVRAPFQNVSGDGQGSILGQGLILGSPSAIVRQV